MYVLVSVLIIIVCILLVLVVLVQNSKGGGLAANFSSQNQMLGVRKTTDFLEKATWTLAIFLLVLCLAASMVIPRETTQRRSLIESQIENAPNPNEAPTSYPTSVPDLEE